MSTTLSVPYSDANVVGELQAIEIDWFGETEIVAITPRDQQRFEIQKDKVIDILRVATQQEGLFRKQINLLFSRLADWLRGHSSKVEQGFLTVHDTAFAFVVVKNDARYDECLEDSLAMLDVELANDEALDLIRLNTLALPPTT